MLNEPLLLAGFGLMIVGLGSNSLWCRSTCGRQTYTRARRAGFHFPGDGEQNRYLRCGDRLFLYAPVGDSEAIRVVLAISPLPLSSSVT